jgi:ABC-type multidrug transport system fused ATPase/permease subunit
MIMSKNLFSFVWKHSSREQMLLLLATAVSFPILYVTLSLPKLILNGAIEGNSTWLNDFVPQISQLEMLWLLSALLLVMIVVNGVLKMRLSIYRGVIGERLIRRFRFAMIDNALQPQPGGSRMAQGEVVSMITAEAEPLTGIMGDAFAQPMFQIGQMLTILAFLFLQNVWLGIAGISLIPVQAYVIPRMQRQVNRLQRIRVGEVRHLSNKISESVIGASELRTNGGRRFKLAEFSHALHRMFSIRVDIFKAKFRIKFINNLLTQVTPFLFYAVGGYLVLSGELSIGALVAAIAAARDLAEPWRELLMFWNGAQEASSRYQSLVSGFGLDRPGAWDDKADELNSMSGDIVFKNLSVSGPDGSRLLDSIDLSIPSGGAVCFCSQDERSLHALANVLTGELVPTAGSVHVGPRNLIDYAPTTRAGRIGYAARNPFIFHGTLGENIRMPVLQRPRSTDAIDEEFSAEARRTGNSVDPIHLPWTSLVTPLDNATPIGDDWWLRIIDALGSGEELLDRNLDARLRVAAHPDLAQSLLSLRPRIRAQLEQGNLLDDIEFFDAAVFSSSLTLGENLLFAVHKPDYSPQALSAGMIEELADLPVAPTLVAFAADVASVLVRSFGQIGIDHPLLRKMTSINAEDLEDLLPIVPQLASRPIDSLTADDRAVLLQLLFKIKPREFGAPVPQAVREAVILARADARRRLGNLEDFGFEPLDGAAYNTSLTIIQNLVGGMLRSGSLAAQAPSRTAVKKIIIESGLEGPMRLLIADVLVESGGENLAAVTKERLSLARALIRKPDIIILDRVLYSNQNQERLSALERVRMLLPEATIIIMEREPPAADWLTARYFVTGGGLTAKGSHPNGPIDGGPPKTMLDDQQDKFLALSQVTEFQGLRRPQLEIMAYAASWHDFEPDEYIFTPGETTDGVYLIISGDAEIRWPERGYDHSEQVDSVQPGRLIGDLSVILDSPRILALKARTKVRCLKIGAAEFRDIFENDLSVALVLLKTVGSHLQGAAQELEVLYRRDNGGSPEA